MSKAQLRRVSFVGSGTYLGYWIVICPLLAFVTETIFGAGAVQGNISSVLFAIGIVVTPVPLVVALGGFESERILASVGCLVASIACPWVIWELLWWIESMNRYGR